MRTARSSRARRRQHLPLRRGFHRLGFFIPALLWSPFSSAADCECTHEVTPDQLTINGDELGVAPGDVVCILGGDREFLRISSMTGSEESPIVIKNCEGQVNIDNDDRGYGLTLDASRYIHLTGTGDEAHTYGFKVRASRNESDYSASCVLASDLSSDYEMDHIEAYECGFAGVVSKTDPSCDQTDMSSFVQRNTRLHHLYLHDTQGEGIYFGNTGYPSRAGTCDGVDVDLIPHTHEGVWIHDNIIEDTGWDGAQIGVSPKDCYFYRNRIARVGLLNYEYQMQGLQIGGGSKCIITDNFLSTGPAIGIIVLDAQDTLIANNVVEAFETGIYFNDRDIPISQGARYSAIHNTVVDTKDRGIAIFGSLSAGNAFFNNLIVSGGEFPLSIGNEVDAESGGNLILDSLTDALFVDAQAQDYALSGSSPGVDAGVDSMAFDVDTDQFGAERDASPDAGAFEFGATAPSQPGAPPGPGQNPSSEQKNGEDREGGCAVAEGRTGSPFPSWPLALFAGLSISLIFRTRGRRIGEIRSPQHPTHQRSNR
jgi:hypothetical protein